MKRKLLLLVLTAVAGMLPAVALAGPLLNVTRTGSSAYVVQGGGFNGAVGLDVIIDYDTADFTAPQVTQGSVAAGTLFLANVNVPGRIHLAFVSVNPIPDSGTVATIKFEAKGSGQGRITGVTASILNSSGKQASLAASFSNQLSGDATAGQSPGNQSAFSGSDRTASGFTAAGAAMTTAASSSANTATGTAGMGTLTMGTAGTETADKKESPPPAAVEPPPVTPPPVEPSPVKGERQEPLPREATPQRLVPPANILQRFRGYVGERTPQTLLALFTPVINACVRQEPPLAPADGKTNLRLILELSVPPLRAPNFALTGAKSLSLRVVGEKSWAIEVLPNAGVVEATLLLMVDDATVNIPLNVVPPLPAAVAGTLQEADVARFIGERGTVKSPLGDLNGDGRRDAIDDYIYLGNYLLQRDAAKVKPLDSAGQKPVK